ncbi:DUF2339 domain-containing protein [Bacillus piscicola]|uniref:DUF2339 domain-containing protein n=1 Tax=Bacillus piscicola TaxID=1632684 RepID=UPI001F08EC22|nr:DUF2339 domain-containing protein [Bacillus piscicola]
MTDEQDQRIAELERRVLLLEKRLEQEQSSKLLPNTYKEKSSESPALEEERSFGALEKHFGKTWLPRIFLFVLLLGVVWAFAAAYDSGLITEPVVLTIGYVVSGGLAAAGMWQYRRKHTGLAQVILAAAVIIPTLTTFAGHALYHLIPLSIAFSTNLVIALATIILTAKYRSQALAILAAIGGFLNPILLDNSDPSVVFFIVYEFIAYILFFSVAAWFRFLFLFYVSIAALHIVYLPVSFFASNTDMYLMYTALALQHLLLLGFFFYWRKHKEYPLGMVFSQYVLLTGWGVLFLTKQQFLIVLLGWLIFHLLAAGHAYWRLQSRLRTGMLLAAISFTIFSLSVRFFDEWMTSTLIISGIVSVLLGYILNSQLQRVVGFVSLGISLWLLAIQTPFETLSTEHVNWVVAVLGLGALYAIGLRWRPPQHVQRFFQVYEMIVVTILLTYTSLVVYAVTHSISEEVWLYSLSFVWIVFAAASIIIGFWKNNGRLRVFGVILLFVTLAKVFFVDISEVSLAVRALLFIALGGMGVALSRFFYAGKGD